MPDDPTPIPTPQGISAGCPECACDPGNPWGCGCSNPSCPCSEEEDEECE